MWNKWDAVAPDRRAELEPLADAADDVAVISAMTGEGVEALIGIFMVVFG